MFIACIVLLCAAVIAEAGPPGPLMMNMKEMNECKTQNSIDEKEMMNLVTKGVLMDETKESARCFVQCCMQKIEGTVDASENFDIALAKKNILDKAAILYMGPPGSGAPVRPTQAVINTAVDECAKLTGTGKCMTNYKIWGCLYQKLHA